MHFSYLKRLKDYLFDLLTKNKIVVVLLTLFSLVVGVYSLFQKDQNNSTNVSSLNQSGGVTANIIENLQIGETKTVSETHFFLYSFSEDNKKVLVQGGDNMEIKSIRWVAPLPNGLYIVNNTNAILTRDDLDRFLQDQLSVFLKLNPINDEQKIQDLLQCAVYQFVDCGDGECGIPLIADIKYSLRAQTATLTTKDLIYIRGLTPYSSAPEIYVASRGISDEISKNFISQNKLKMELAFSYASMQMEKGPQKTSSDECRLQVY